MNTVRIDPKKQLTETPDSQFISDFQYTIPFYCFLTILSILFACYVDSTSNTVL